MVCLESWQIVEWAVSQPQECFYVELLLSFGSAFNVSFVARTFAQSTFALDENEKHVHNRFQRRYLLHIIIITNRAISYVGFFLLLLHSMAPIQWWCLFDWQFWAFFALFFLTSAYSFSVVTSSNAATTQHQNRILWSHLFLHNARMILTVYLLRPHNFCVRFV